jgi:hypothetical protein
MARTPRTQAARTPSAKAPGAGGRRNAAPGAAANKKKTAPPTAGVTDGERYLLIAEAAYYRAERRGFAPGHELEDWLDAETEVGRMVAVARTPPASEKA